MSGHGLRPSRVPRRFKSACQRSPERQSNLTDVSSTHAAKGPTARLAQPATRSNGSPAARSLARPFRRDRACRKQKPPRTSRGLSAIVACELGPLPVLVVRLGSCKVLEIRATQTPGPASSNSLDTLSLVCSATRGNTVIEAVPPTCCVSLAGTSCPSATVSSARARTQRGMSNSTPHARKCC